MRCLDKVLETQVRCLDKVLETQVRCLDKFGKSPCLAQVSVIKEFRHIFAWMDNRTNTRPLHEAVRDQMIGWIIALERVTSVLRLIQTLIVLLEWLIPLLEDVRLSNNQRDIVVMLKDNLMDLEVEIQRQACEIREHILGRYHGALDG